MKDNTKSSSSRLSNIWLTVLLLVVMVLASAALLGSFIKRYVAQEKNVIAVMADSNDVRNEYNDKSLPAGANPGLKPSWENTTSIDLFKNTYTNHLGEVTVESANKDKVIAPGTSHDYEFNLKNTGNISLDYTLTLKGVFDLHDHHLPFYVRLSRGDKWVVGGDEHWVNVDALETVVEKNTLPIGEKVTYTFEWQWPYETDAETAKLIDDLNKTFMLGNPNDTNLGNVTADADFHLSVITSAEVTPGAIATFNDGVSVVNELVFVISMAGLILGSGIWLIILLFRRKIYFTGLLAAAVGDKIKLGKAKSELGGFGGRFVFPKARFGKRNLATDNASVKIKFKSRKVESGLAFDYGKNKDLTYIIVDRKVRAVELHLTTMGDKLVINTVNWAAIDKKHNVITPQGVTPPVDDCNTTPYGLSIDGDNKLFIKN